MFQLVFKVLGNAAQLSIQFIHIHGTGLRTVTVNICKKQAGGKYIIYICIAYANNIQALETTYIQLTHPMNGMNTFNICLCSA